MSKLLFLDIMLINVVHFECFQLKFLHIAPLMSLYTSSAYYSTTFVCHYSYS